MMQADPYPGVCMERPNLENLPPLLLPEGFTIRSIAVDEGHFWETVMNSAEGGGYGPGDFHRIMVENYDYDPSRVFVMFTPDREPCATASSWRQLYRWGAGVGYLLFVAVAKPYQGRGLGYWISLRVLHDFVRHGLACSVLETGEANYPAIKTYLKLGYLPRLLHESHAERWQAIFRALNMKPWEYPRVVRPPEDAPHPPRPYPYELKMSGAG